MKAYREKSITLLELIICIVLIGMTVLGFFSIHIFSRYHLITSVRRAKLQNDVSYVLEHMAKHIGRAIGDTVNYPINFVNPALRVRVEPTRLIAYNYDSGQHLLQFCFDFSNSTGTCTSGYETLSRYITSNMSSSYVTFNNGINYITVNIAACWNPTNLSSCGYSENPDISMTTRIKMPSVSVR